MKKTFKYLSTLIVAIALILVLRVPAQASGNLKQTKCTANSVTVSWTTPSMYSSNYKLTGYMLSADNGAYTKSDIAADATSATISLPANYIGYLRLYYYYRYTNPYDGSTKDDNSFCDSTYVNTGISTPKKDHFAATSFLPTTKKVSIEAATYNSQHRTQLQIFKGDSSKPFKTVNFRGSSEYISVKKNTVYRFRIRNYYQNTDSGTTTFSNWSPCRAFVMPDFKYAGGKKCYKLKMKKVNGVSKYVAKTSKKNDSGFKTSKSFKAKNKKSYTVTIKKNVYPKKTNYFKLYIYIKTKKFNGMSDCIGTGSTYIRK